jgi:hypothetical protein
MSTEFESNELKGRMTILTLLDKANGPRRKRILGPTALDEIIADCKEEGDHSSIHAGLVANAYPNAALTTLAVAARIDGKVFVGVRAINAKTKGSPAAGWDEWKNFDRSGPEKQAEKLRKWWDNHIGSTVVQVVE